MITLDFETHGIEPRPDYPPKPVGVSVRVNDGEDVYYAWGHPTGNNCSEGKARRIIEKIWASSHEIVMHNAAFDLEVARVHFGVPDLPWRRVHDTMFLLFLSEPHSESLSLKPSAERLLDLPPTEQDEVRDWLVNAGIARRSDRAWGKHIAMAPGDLVGKYAKGDTLRTYKLFKLLYKEIKDRGMEEAYDRERRVLPILMRNEREGMRLDERRLARDAKMYTAAKETVEAWLSERLGCDINFNSAAEVADVLDATGMVTEWKLTKTGRRSTAKGSLTPDMFADPQVAQAFGYRSRLSTCLGTFFLPWANLAVDGHLVTSWNQVRTRGSGASTGTRTGRPSTQEPNFLNVPKTFYDKNDGYVHPAFLDIPELPLMRVYLLPDEGEVFLHRDYNQQELRLLGHFEDGLLMEAYNKDPMLDVHNFVGDEIFKINNVRLSRRATKIINFGMIYGLGLGGLAADLDTSIDEAKDLKAAQLQAIPGLKNLTAAIKGTVRRGEPIRTWGGREYYVEEPKVIGGRYREFTYKLLNYLIQGSAADVTKEALIRYDATRVHSRFLVTVYDEINISAPKRHAREEMAILREAMEGIENIDVPMLSDGKYGPNWGSLEKYND